MTSVRLGTILLIACLGSLTTAQNGVTVTLNGNLITPGSSLCINDIGEGPADNDGINALLAGDALVCRTTNTMCCRAADTGSIAVGEWFVDNTLIQALSQNPGAIIHRTRGTGLLRLNNRGGGNIGGEFCCELPGANGTTERRCVNVDSPGSGSCIASTAPFITTLFSATTQARTTGVATETEREEVTTHGRTTQQTVTNGDTTAPPIPAAFTCSVDTGLLISTVLLANAVVVIGTLFIVYVLVSKRKQQLRLTRNQPTENNESKHGVPKYNETTTEIALKENSAYGQTGQPSTSVQNERVVGEQIYYSEIQDSPAYDYVQ